MNRTAALVLVLVFSLFLLTGCMDMLQRLGYAFGIGEPPAPEETGGPQPGQPAPGTEAEVGGDTPPLQHWGKPSEPQTGDPSMTCAAQGYSACKKKEYCDQGNWSFSSDEETCCASGCHDRIQAVDVPFEGIEGANATIEKFGQGRYGAWWGEVPGSDTAKDVVGHPKYSNAVSEGDDVYSFLARTEDREKKHYRFSLDDKGTEIDVQPLD